MQHQTRRKRKGWNARCWRIPRARARSSKQTSTIVLEIKELVVIVPDIENILERLFNYRVTKLFFFLETSLKINWNSAFETDENGSKMDPIFQLVKGNESLVIYFWKGEKAPQFGFWPPSNH